MEMDSFPSGPLPDTKAAPAAGMQPPDGQAQPGPCFQPEAEPPQPVFAGLTAQQAYSHVGLALFVMTVLTFALQMVLLVLAQLQPALGAADWYLYFCTFAPQYLVAMPVAALLMRRVPSMPPAQHKLRPGHFATACIFCIGIMYLGNLIGTLLSAVLSGGSAENPLSVFLSSISPLQILVVVVLAPIAEELIFRKLLIDRLGRYGGALAVAASSLCFGLYHMNLFQFFYAAGLGWLFGYLYLRTGRVRYNIALHMGINFLGGVAAPLILQLVDMDALQNSDIAYVLSHAGSILLLCAYEILLLGLAVVGIIMLICARRKFVFLPAPDQVPYGARRTVFLNAGMVLFVLLCLAMLVLNTVLA